MVLFNTNKHYNMNHVRLATAPGMKKSNNNKKHPLAKLRGDNIKRERVGKSEIGEEENEKDKLFFVKLYHFHFCKLHRIKGC